MWLGLSPMAPDFEQGVQRSTANPLRQVKWGTANRVGAGNIHHPQIRRASPSEGATQTSSTHSHSFKLDKTRRQGLPFQGTFACVNHPPQPGRQSNHVRATRKSDKACLPPFKFFGHARESISGSRPLSLSRLPLKRSQCNSSCLEHACLSQLARFYGFCKCSQVSQAAASSRSFSARQKRQENMGRSHGARPRRSSRESSTLRISCSQ